MYYINKKNYYMRGGGQSLLVKNGKTARKSSTQKEKSPKSSILKSIGEVQEENRIKKLKAFLHHISKPKITGSSIRPRKKRVTKTIQPKTRKILKLKKPQFKQSVAGRADRPRKGKNIKFKPDSVAYKKYENNNPGGHSQNPKLNINFNNNRNNNKANLNINFNNNGNKNKAKLNNNGNNNNKLYNNFKYNAYYNNLPKFNNN